MTLQEAKALIGLCIDEGLKQGVLKNRGEFEELFDYLDKYFVQWGAEHFRGVTKKVEPPCHTVDEWIEHIKNADQLTKDIFSKGPYDVLYDALNHSYQHCYDAIKEFGELCYQIARQDMMKEAVEGEAHPDDCEIWVNLVGYGYRFNDGDKVHLIIIKEDWYE